MQARLALVCILAIVPAAARADDVYLKSGGKVSGRILSRTETSVAVDVGPGTITVPMTSVLRIEESRSILDEHHDRAARLRAGDAPGWLQLAKWSASQGLATQARQAYERVLTIDPENEDANRALDRVRLDGRWVSEAESFRARGYVHFEGAWMAPSEREAILTRRDTTLAAERAQLDAQLRVREAEARAAEAEARARAAEATSAYGMVGAPLWWGGYDYGWGSSGSKGYRTNRGRYSTEIWPTQPVGPWSSLPSLYPSQPLGLWSSPARQPGGSHRSGGGPARPSGPARQASPSPPVNGAGAGAGGRSPR